MKIQDILLFLPRGFYSSIAKMNRIALNEKVKDEILLKGMYHFVPKESVADQIISSEYLKPSKNIVTSYGGKSCTYLFCGNPDIDNFKKNLTLLKNPYINPTMVADAIKFFPKSRDDLKNYKFRALSDGAVLYEGFCILPHEQVKKVKMVPDLVRDENGTPVKDREGNFTVAFREASREELLPDGTEYSAKTDYLEYMKEKAKEYGYLDNEKLYGKIGNIFVNIIDATRMEKDVMRHTIRNNWKDVIKNFISNIKLKKMPLTVDDTLKSFSFAHKNPYLDTKFATYVAELQSQQGITQLDLKDLLIDFNQSKEGEFFREKYNKINENVTRKGIHGKSHSSRTALTAMIIAQKEGILDENNRIKDILMTTMMYHDIGRVLDVGPHARRGVKKIQQMELFYEDGTPYSEDDKKLVLALVDSHEGKPDKINRMIQKYGITNQNDINLAIRLNSIVRDSDALDRVRIDQKHFGYKVNLNPKYLVNNTSKQLLNFSYQLEFLTNQIKDMNQILRYGTPMSDSTKKEVELENTLEQYKVEIQPTISSENLKKDKDIRIKNETDKSL